jgi:hypothetical protein
MDNNENESKWDLFVSYASEDRSEVVEPLVTLLSALGLKVWYDRRELKVGDGLRRKIDEGLARCRYGVVVLSPSFFGKHYPNRELDGLAQREVDGKTVILPVWFGVTDSDVRSYSPVLADRIAACWEDGVLAVVLRILEVVRPDLMESLEAEHRKFSETIVSLPQLRSASDLAQVLNGALAFCTGNDEPKDEDEVELIAGVQQYIQDWLDIIDDLDVGERVRMEFDLAKQIRLINDAGWTLFGRQVRQPTPLSGKEPWPIALVVFARQGAKEVFQVESQKFVVLRSAA